MVSGQDGTIDLEHFQDGSQCHPRWRWLAGPCWRLSRGGVAICSADGAPTCWLPPLPATGPSAVPTGLGAVRPASAGSEGHPRCPWLWDTASQAASGVRATGAGDSGEGRAGQPPRALGAIRGARGSEGQEQGCCARLRPSALPTASMPLLCGVPGPPIRAVWMRHSAPARRLRPPALPPVLPLVLRLAHGACVSERRWGSRSRGGPTWQLGSSKALVLRSDPLAKCRREKQLSAPRGDRRALSRRASSVRGGAAAGGGWQSCEQQGGCNVHRRPPPRWRNPQHALGAWEPAVRERALLFDRGWHEHLPRGQAQESARLGSRLSLRRSEYVRLRGHHERQSTPLARPKLLS